jgi:4a-hydroxytetrahydrobiopterin dehydratase
MSTADNLAGSKCKPCTSATPPLTDKQAADLLQQLDSWSRLGHAIVKAWHFRDYHETMAFVNAAAWISQREDHHPDLAVGYDKCTASYTTHAIGGLSLNDFICAAKLDALFEL